MATAKRLPSGNYRVRVYSHTDNSGRKVYESFTARTKQEAEMMATQFANDNDRNRAQDLTVKEAVQSYIDSNKAALSPSTIYGYMADAKRIDCIGNLRIRKLTSKDIQGLVTEMMNKELSPKTIKNTYALLRSSLTFSGIDKKFMVHLPSVSRKTKNSPENDQIEALYNAASKQMKIAIALGAFHSLRRGEIAALKYGDIQGNMLTIHADVVRGVDKKWNYKATPKTDASNRVVYLPQQLLDLIGTGDPDEFILGIYPDSISASFRRLKRNLGIDITFHDLRHYFASLAVILDIPDVYTASLGGWRNNSSVLKTVYQGNIVSMQEAYANRINEQYKSMTQNMTQTNKKAAQP